MLVTPAFAQDAGGVGGGGLEAMLPLVLIFVVFYFLLIRPQQKKMKQHKATLAAIRRGDKVVTGGGIIGTVTKVSETDPDVQVEIAKDVKVKVQRELIAAVLSKTDAVDAKSPKAAIKGEAANDDSGSQGGSLLGKLFGKK